MLLTPNHLAPAQDAISNEKVVFSSAFGIERSLFQGEPNDENDKLWTNLYDCKLRYQIRLDF